jgi:glucose-1-phosphate thymidylyltransferase
VNNPESYGVVGFDNTGKVNSIVEKPRNPASSYAVTGLYFVDGTAPIKAKKIKPSKRGELEITSLLESYLNEGNLTVNKMGRGFAWLDTGTHSSLLDASNFVRLMTDRQGLQVGSPDEVAYLSKFINSAKLTENAEFFSKNAYGDYLKAIIDN